jgi:hypothetical protein
MLYALILALAIPTYGPIPAPSSSPPAYLRVPTVATEALIVNSGSTNRAGYRLRVYADGTTALQQGDPSTGSGLALPMKKSVPMALVKQFFADLKAAGPLDQMISARCMKSASFGSTTRIGYLDKMSSDVSCPGGPAMRKLQVDAGALADAAGVSMLPRPGS